MASAPILVTGGTGLIGSSITEHLARAGHRVVTFDLVSAPDNVDPAAGDLTLLTGDICDTGALATTLAQHGIDHIAHMAAVLSEGPTTLRSRAHQFSATPPEARRPRYQTQPAERAAVMPKVMASANPPA